jgi:lysophospholipase L1-like esterase
MKQIKYLTMIFALALIASACKPTIDVPAPTAGTADFTTYVALGNSLTSGYTDGELFASGQKNSYPSMLARQFSFAGGKGEFKQPLMFDEVGFGARRKLALVQGTDGSVSLGVVAYGGTVNPQNYTSTATAGPFNNMGVPGAKSYHLTFKGYGNPANAPNYNPYYTRFATSTTSSVLEDALAQNPTFYTLWIGNNDVLGYALAGGSSDAITPLATFTASITAVVQALKAKGAKGVIGNIPDVTSIPFFNTVPYNALAITDAASVAALNAAYGNGALGISFKVGANAFVIKDPAAPRGMRQIKSTELVLLTLPTDSVKLKGWGSQKPIPANYVLDETEIANIKKAVVDYNQAISTIAAANGIPVVDMNTNFKQVQSGIVYNGLKLNATFISGGAFSLDGVHMNARGYAVITNYFIDAINSYYKSTVPKVEVSDYPGIVFP